MKVLVTGGYGFIGAHIVEQFSIEGNEVCVIDNLSTGSKRNVTNKHRFYNISAEDPRCEAVFETNKFDIVIHCASIEPESEPAEAGAYADGDIPALKNLLMLSRKFAVRQLIYLSSTEVYGQSNGLNISETALPDPKTPLGFQKLLEEQFCDTWSTYYHFNVLCLRLAYVFGVEQRPESRFGIVAALANHVVTENTEYNDGRAIDLLYVKDVSEAVYRAAMAELSGVYNLTSGANVSITSLFGMFPNSYRFRINEQMDSLKIADPGCSYDGTRLAKDLDWAPCHELDEGLRKTLASHRSDRRGRKREAEKSTRLKDVFRVSGPYLLNALMFAAMLLVGIFAREVFEAESMVLILVYIAVVGLSYGSRQSILSVILALMLFIYSEVSNGENMMSVLYDPAELLNIGIILFTGIFFGSYIDKKNQKLIEIENKYLLLNEKYEFLQEINKENIEIKDSLHKQIVNSQDSFGKVFSIISELDSLEPDRILFSAVKVIETIMKQPIALYSVTNSRQYLRLAASSNNDSVSSLRSIKIKSGAPYDQVVREGALFVNRELLPNVPFLIAAIRKRNEVIGVIVLYQPEFQDITLHYQNLFAVVAELVSSSLARAIDYSKAELENAYIGDTMLLNESAFRAALKARTETLSEFNVPYTILSAHIDGGEIEERGATLVNSLRESDLFGVIGSRIYMLIVNVNQQDCWRVMDRLRLKGFVTSVAEE